MQSSHFIVTSEGGKADAQVESLLELLEGEFRRLERELQYTPEQPIHVYVHASTARFVHATGRPWWVAALTRATSIEMQPFETLRKRGIERSTLGHELAHVFINGLTHNRCPLWLNEALAVYLSGEGEALLRKYGTLLQDEEHPASDKIEADLQQAKTQVALEQQYLKAYLLLQSRINTQGIDKLLGELKGLGR